MIVGQKWFGAEVLQTLTGLGHDVAAVSAPRLDDRLAACAADTGVPVCTVEGALDGRWVPGGVDLIVCAHAHVFVTAGARAAARLGAIGYHPSLLPRHRGRHAVEWTVRMRDLVAGGTVYRLDDGADTGPIVAQDWCWVLPGDTAGELWRRELAPMGLRLIAQAVDHLSAHAEAGSVQNERLATWEPAIRAARLSG